MFLLIKKESTLNRNTPLEIILSHCGVVPGEESSGKIWSEFQRLFFQMMPTILGYSVRKWVM
jgi:hypothetical protein